MKSDPHLDALFVYQCDALDVIAAQHDRAGMADLLHTSRRQADSLSPERFRFDQHRAWAEEARDARKIA